MDQHAAKMDKNMIQHSLARTYSSSLSIRYVDVPSATIVAGEFAVYTLQVTEESLRLSFGEEASKASGQETEIWTVMKRYSSIRKFHGELRKSFAHTRRQRPPPSPRKSESKAPTELPNEFEIPLPKFPPKKWFGNRSPHFVEVRRAALAEYFRKLVSWSKVGVTRDVRISMLREYLTFSDPEIAKHRMFAVIRHGPKEKPSSVTKLGSNKHIGSTKEPGDAGDQNHESKMS